MISLGTAVLLQQAAAGQDYSFFVMMGAIFIIFYFLLIRPQQRRQKEHEERLKSLMPCEDTSYVAPCRVGDIIVEDASGDSVEVWKRD